MEEGLLAGRPEDERGTYEEAGGSLMTSTYYVAEWNLENPVDSENSTVAPRSRGTRAKRHRRLHTCTPGSEGSADVVRDHSPVGLQATEAH